MLNIFKKKEEVSELKAYVSGNVISIEEVNDPVFSSKAMGDGVAIIPTENTITAPCDAKVKVVMKDTGHAIGLELSNGMEILIHVGVDTVKMNGEGFKLHVGEGDKVKKGETLITFDRELIKASGYATDCICALINGAEYDNVELHVGITANQDETTIVSF